MKPQSSPERSSEPGGRREEVARATWRVIAREGLDRASLRAIAQELGCTTGVLTHYFRDKEALLDFALSAIAEHLSVGEPDASQDLSDPDALRDYLTPFLPTSGESRIWWKVWLSFTVAAFSNDRLGANHAKLYVELRKFWATQFTRLRDEGVLAREIDPALESESFLCLIDGIGIQALISPRALNAKRQVEIVEGYLERLFRTRRT